MKVRLKCFRQGFSFINSFYQYIYMCVCVCVCVKIMGINVYIYIYIGMCVWVCVCCGIIFDIFEAAPESLDIPLSILAQRPHKEPFPRKHARPEERMKNVVSLGVRFRSRESVSSEWDSGAGSQTFRAQDTERRASSKTWVQTSRRAVWSQERRGRAVKTMTRWVSIFGSCVWFSR